MAKYLDLDGLAYYKSKEDLLLANKVDKETGKGLSTNDYTTAEKTKLSGIETAAEVNVLEGVQLNGTTITPTNKIANIEINVPTSTSELTNDSGFITNTVNNLTNYYTKTNTYTKSEVDSLIGSVSSLDIQIVQTLPTRDISTSTIYLVPKTASTNDNYDEYIYVNNSWEHIGSTEIDLSNYYTKTQTDNLLNDKADSSDIPTKVSDLTNDVGYSTFSGSYNDLTNKPTIPTKTSDLTNDSGFITSSALGGYVPTSRTINSKALTNNITLSASDVGALSSSTTYVSSVNGSSGDITGLQTTSNLSTSIDETSTDTEYPSAKAVYDSQVEQNEKIEELERYKTIYNVLPKVEDEGEALTLNDTGNASLKIDLKGNTTQNGTPTPDAPIPIQTTTGEQEIIVCGKNLFDVTSQIQHQYATNGSEIISDKPYSLSNNVVTISTNLDAGRKFLNKTSYKTGTYTISGNIKFINSTTYKLWYSVRDFANSVDIVNTSFNVNRATGTFNFSFTLANNLDSVGISLQPNTPNDGTIELTNLQVEYGNQTTYEPYQSQTYEINLGNIELCKIGDYQDRIYKDNGKWYKYRAIYKMQLDGSRGTESWNSWGVAQRKNGLIKFRRQNWLYNISFGVISTHFIGSNLSGTDNANMDNNTIYAYNKGLSIVLEESKYPAIDNLLTMLEEKKPTVYYVLATPTTTEITDTTLISQLDELESAMSYKGQTNISQINNDAPFIISASALYDLNNLVTRVAILETE